MDPIRQAFDRIAARYAADFFHELDRKPFDRELLRRVAGLERPRGPVIEVGCGPGHVGRFLAGAGMPDRRARTSPWSRSRRRAGSTPA